MKKTSQECECLNCGARGVRCTRNYCPRCYPLILRIEKIRNGVLPQILEEIKKKYDFFELSKKEYIRQVERRLEVIKDSESFMRATPHELEQRINETLKFLRAKTLGKMNDSIAHYLEDENARSYVHRLFSRIQLLKPFRIDYWRVYDVKKENK